jgi:hypothetical protein
MPVDANGRPEISEALTYRTQAPEPEEAPTIPTMGEEFNPALLADASGDFVEAWNYLAAYHHQLMLAKGFWNGEHAVVETLEAAGRTDLVAVAIAAFDGQKIALQTSEASEAWEIRWLSYIKRLFRAAMHGKAF